MPFLKLWVGQPVGSFWRGVNPQLSPPDKPLPSRARSPFTRCRGAAHERNQAVRKRAPPTQVIVPAYEFLVVNLISFCTEYIPHLPTLFKGAVVTSEIDIIASCVHVKAQWQTRTHNVLVWQPGFGIRIEIIGVLAPGRRPKIRS
jgi:hypothetical protein